MLNVVIFGAPGSGKGTQSELIIKEYGLDHISTGDVLRAEMKGETELGKIAKDYIEKGQYFTINRARQYGKTTTLYLLERRLREEYIVLSLSFEAADEYFESMGSLAEGLVMDISECLKAQNVDGTIIEEWNRPLSERFPMRSLGIKISSLCKTCGKKIILMIDEVDKSSDNQIFLSFLGLLREKYLKWQQGKDETFQSVILAGVYDVKTLKLKLHPQEEMKYNSPWNIAVDFQMDMSFDCEDIESMLKEYESEHRTGMHVQDIARIIYDYTSGYPYLVSRICQIIDERIAGIKEFGNVSSAWTKEGVLAAIKILLKEPNTLFDDMTKKLSDYPQLQEMLQNILFGGIDFPFKSSASGNGHQLFCFFFPRSIAPIYRHICVDDGGLGKDAPWKKAGDKPTYQMEAHCCRHLDRGMCGHGTLFFHGKVFL